MATSRGNQVVVVCRLHIKGATIDHQAGAIDERGVAGGEISNRIGDILDRGDATHGNRILQILDHTIDHVIGAHSLLEVGAHRRGTVRGEDEITMITAIAPKTYLTQLTRTPFGPSSSDMHCVIEKVFQLKITLDGRLTLVNISIAALATQ